MGKVYFKKVLQSQVNLERGVFCGGCYFFSADKSCPKNSTCSDGGCFILIPATPEEIKRYKEKRGLS